MAYCKVPDGMSFNTEFPTYVIGFCPDTNEIFVTNKRFWYAIYDCEFETRSAGIKYVFSHWNELLIWKNQFETGFNKSTDLWLGFPDESTNIYYQYDINDGVSTRKWPAYYHY